MGDPAHKPLPKIRTFALDQAHARGDVIEPEKKTTPIVEEKITVTVPEPPKEVQRHVVKETPIVVKEKSVPQPPAFHELLKQPAKTPHAAAPAPIRASVTVRTPTKPTIVTPPRNIHATDAVVISSGKKTEFNLFREIVKGLSGWWKDLTKADQKNSTYTVRDVHERKQVIEKATTKTGAAAVSTPSTLKESIAKKREASPSEHGINWSPQTEPGYPLLPQEVRPAPAPVIIYKQKSSPTKDLAAEKIEPARRFVPPSEEIEGSGFEKEPEVFRYTPPPPQPQPVTPPPPPQPPKLSIEREVPPPPPPPVEPVKISIPKTPNPPSSYLKNGLRKLVRFDTTVTTVLVAGTVVSFVLMFFIVRTLIAMIAPEASSSEVAVSSRESILPQAVVSDIALGEFSKQGFIQSFRSASRPSQGIAEYQVTEAGGTPISPARLWNIFGFKTNPNFIQAIETLRVGYVDGQLVLVLEVSDPTTVFGSLLTWEQTMYEELSAMFGLPVSPVETVRDSTIGTSDIRILVAEDGRELAAYGFIGNDVVIISTTSQTFTTLNK